jgi:hypothetical protein
MISLAPDFHEYQKCISPTATEQLETTAKMGVEYYAFCHYRELTATSITG